MSLIADDPCPEKFCAHCGQASSDYSSSSFCCAGCESVFGILQSKGLGDFYKIRKRVGALGKKQNLPSASQSYAYLNGPAFLGAHAERDGLQMRFYLDGVHCAAYPQVAEEFELMGYPAPTPSKFERPPKRSQKKIGGNCCGLASRLLAPET